MIFRLRSAHEDHFPFASFFTGAISVLGEVKSLGRYSIELIPRRARDDGFPISKRFDQTIIFGVGANKIPKHLIVMDNADYPVM